MQNEQQQHPISGIQKVAQVIAVASGKGGVGKTTVAVNLVDIEIHEAGDQVTPLVIAKPDSESAQRFVQLAERLAKRAEIPV